MRLTKLIVVSGLILASLGIYKLHYFATEQLKDSSTPKKVNYKDSSLKRMHIFYTGFFSNKQLSPLITHRKNKFNKVEPVIDETQLETVLKPLIKEKLKTIFYKYGWNFEELDGRVYYEINGRNLELYVVWKNNVYSKNFTYFDRFTIRI